MKQLTRLSPTASVGAVMNVLDEDGAVIVENLASPGTMELIESELAPHWQDIPYGDSEFIGFRTQRATRLVALSRGCGELAMNPLVLGAMDQILSPFCKRYHLHVTNGVRVGSDETPQLLHRDDELFRGYIPRPRPRVLTNVIWALSDFRRENGATRVVPGSHRWDDDREPDETQFVQAEMPAGSVMIYLGSTFHGAAANTTGEPRTGIILGYSLGWLRQEENQYLAVPPAAAKSLPEPLQHLIGYAVHPPFLGWVDMKDPHSALEEDSGPGLLQPMESGRGS